MNPTTANHARLDEWLDTLASETDQARHSELFTAYLTAMARFWSYSRRNSMLIFIQRPRAQYVNSRKRWEELGYTLKKDQWRNSIQILCPHFKKMRDDAGKEEQALTHFTTGYIYDETQVEAGPTAQPLSAPWSASTADAGDLFDVLHHTCTRLGVNVSERDDLADVLHGYSDGAGHIVLNSRHTIGDRTQTLAHELAHEVAHPRNKRGDFTRQQVECQAEAVSYCICTALGLASPNSPTYLALYGVSRETIQANADAIRACVHTILREVERATGQQAADEAA